MTHLALLLAEGTLATAIVLSLFRLRQRIGLAPLYLVVGAFQYLQVVLATTIRIEIPGTLLVNPGSAVLFPVTTIAVLLTYIEEDAEETRKLAYGVAIANLTAHAVAGLAGLHLTLPGHQNPLGVPVTLFHPGLRMPLASSVAMFVDVVGAVVVFELVSRRFAGWLFGRLWVSMLAVMALDTAVFTVGAFAGRPTFWTVLQTGFVAKIAGATFYAILVALYVRHVELPRQAGAGHRPQADLFSWLTYRQRYEHARSLMARDGLTGLYNRGYFDEFLPRQVAHGGRAHHRLTLVLADVDGLKVANDRHGHPAGDALLKFVAAETAGMTRAADAACRYGGDEFAVVLTSADSASARIFADRLAERVRRHSMALHPRPAWAPASITVGLATFPEDGRTAMDLLQRADERLYAGKRAGGGCVVSTGPIS